MTFDATNPYADVVPCPNHGDEPSYTQECKQCRVEYDARNDALGNQGNQARLITERLAKDNVTMPNEVVQSVRLNVLIESMLQSRDRMLYEAECGSQIIDQLRHADKEVAKASGIQVAHVGRIQHPTNGLRRVK